jgi:hypothetical protein
LVPVQPDSTEQSQRFSKPSSIYVISMQRAGHHAVINWLGGHYSEFTLRNDFDHENRIEEFTSRGDGSCTFSNVEDYDLQRSLKAIESDSINSAVKILVLRDPYNLFASRLSAKFTVRAGALTELAKNIWKEQATEYLNRQHVDICVSYNRWFLDREYRKNITDRLGLDYNENRLQAVPEFGYGSSFDSCDYSGRASEMKVLERWKAHATNQEFLDFIRDQELEILSNRIFGPICSF